MCQKTLPRGLEQAAKLQLILATTKTQRDGWSSGCAWLVRQAVLELHGCFVFIIQMTCPQASFTQTCTGLPSSGHQWDTGATQEVKNHLVISQSLTVEVKKERDFFFHLFSNKSSSCCLFFPISYFSIRRYGAKKHCTSQIIVKLSVRWTRNSPQGSNNPLPVLFQNPSGGP